MQCEQEYAMAFGKALEKRANQQPFIEFINPLAPEFSFTF
jgi:hypothetical protein